MMLVEQLGRAAHKESAGDPAFLGSPGVATALPGTSRSPRTTMTYVRARKHAIRQVVIIEVAGRLGDVVEDLDRPSSERWPMGPAGSCAIFQVCSGTPNLSPSRCSRRQGDTFETGSVSPWPSPAPTRGFSGGWLATPWART